jgi:hypothetical protein
LIPEAGGRIDLGPRLDPRGPAELVALRFEAAQRPVLMRWGIVARDDALNDRRREGCLVRSRRERQQRTGDRRSENQATVIWERLTRVLEIAGRIVTVGSFCPARYTLNPS